MSVRIDSRGYIGYMYTQQYVTVTGYQIMEIEEDVGYSRHVI